VRALARTLDAPDATKSNQTTPFAPAMRPRAPTRDALASPRTRVATDLGFSSLPSIRRPRAHCAASNRSSALITAKISRTFVLLFVAASKP